jgi:hypothetical protein
MGQSILSKIAISALFALFFGGLPVSAQVSEANRLWQEQQTMMQDAFQRGDRIAGCQHLNLATGYLTLLYGELSTANQRIDAQAESYRRVAVAENISSQFPTSTNALMNLWIERKVTGIKGKVSMEDSARLDARVKQAQLKLDHAHETLQLAYSQTWERYCQ